MPQIFPQSASGVFEASLAVNGVVVRGKKLTINEAVENRRKGYNVVVCGSDFRSNRDRAEMIEGSVEEKAARLAQIIKERAGGAA